MASDVHINFLHFFGMHHRRGIFIFKSRHVGVALLLENGMPVIQFGCHGVGEVYLLLLGEHGYSPELLLLFL